MLRMAFRCISAVILAVVCSTGQAADDPYPTWSLFISGTSGVALVGSPGQVLLAGRADPQSGMRASRP